MGCDIHLYKEKQVKGKWVAADEWTPFDYGDGDKGMEVNWKNRFTDRNYELFGLLSKRVRSEHEYSFEPRGLPYNACKEIADHSESWGEDGHSHSYLYLHELKDMVAFLKTTTITITGMKDKDELKALREAIAAGNPDWDKLYPYCRWTNVKDHEKFELEVPAHFYMGEGLERIIASFDGIDGENHRIVFFFDN